PGAKGPSPKNFFVSGGVGVWAGGAGGGVWKPGGGAGGGGLGPSPPLEHNCGGHLENRLSQPPVLYSKDLNTYYYAKSKRFEKEAEPIHMRLKGFKEIYPPFDRDEILMESERCLSCGLCFDCGNCYMYCPDNAVKKSQTAGRYEFDLDFCKGCGLCAKECPCHYIQMILEK
nr:4Fe-4S binding protein [Candidatus Desulfatibia profunda]